MVVSLSPNVADFLPLIYIFVMYLCSYVTANVLLENIGTSCYEVSSAKCRMAKKYYFKNISSVFLVETQLSQGRISHQSANLISKWPSEWLETTSAPNEVRFVQFSYNKASKVSPYFSQSSVVY